MISSRHNTGVPDLPAECVFIRFLPFIKPVFRRAGSFRHVRKYQVSVRQNIPNLSQVNPHTMQAAGGMALIKRTAAHGFGFQQAGVNAMG